MGLFGSILHKLGFGEEEKESVQPVEVASVTEAVQEVAPAAQESVEAVQEVAETKEVPVVDVMKHLEELSSKHSGLNWKTSIVDLLKLLGLESSYSSRKEMAKELECPADLMSDSAKMNMWLHKTVLRKISENGGNIPENLLS